MDLVTGLRCLEMQLGALSALSTLHLGPFDDCLFVSQDLGALEGPQNDWRPGEFRAQGRDLRLARVLAEEGGLKGAPLEGHEARG
jgi:hypothetical protein